MKNTTTKKTTAKTPAPKYHTHALEYATGGIINGTACYSLEEAKGLQEEWSDSKIIELRDSKIVELQGGNANDIDTARHLPVPAANIVERFEILDVKNVLHSKTNPRQRRDPKKFADLVASVTSKGVVQPILTRPHPKLEGKYELIAGSRRLDASIEAKRPGIPSMIRDLDDDAVLEIQLIENAIREDVHPLEECEAYAKLLTRPGYTRQIIAEKVGHDENHIGKRLRLAKLIDKVKALFLDGVINIGHANALAALEADQQLEVIEGKKNSHDGGGLFIHSWQRGDIKTPVTVAQLNAYIRTNVLMDLSQAPWKRDDAVLLATAGSCEACQKRSGANTYLFDEIAPKGDMCLDSNCFEAKAVAHLVQIQVTRADDKLVKISASYSPMDKEAMHNGAYELLGKKKACGSAKNGLFVDGPQRGHVVKICFDNTCKEHRGKYGTTGAARTPEGKVDYWKQREEGLKKAIALASRRKQLAAILKKGIKPQGKFYSVPIQLMQALCHVALQDHNLPPELIEAFPAGIFKDDKRMTTHGQLKQQVGKNDLDGTILLGVMLHEAVREWTNTDAVPDMLRVGKALGVDVDKVAADVKKEMTDTFIAKRDKAKANKEAKAKKTPGLKPAAVKAAIVKTKPVADKKKKGVK